VRMTLMISAGVSCAAGGTAMGCPAAGGGWRIVAAEVCSVAWADGDHGEQGDDHEYRARAESYRGGGFWRAWRRWAADPPLLRVGGERDERFARTKSCSLRTTRGRAALWVADVDAVHQQTRWSSGAAAVRHARRDRPGEVMTRPVGNRP